MEVVMEIIKMKEVLVVQLKVVNQDKVKLINHKKNILKNLMILIIIVRNQFNQNNELTDISDNHL